MSELQPPTEVAPPSAPEQATHEDEFARPGLRERLRVFGYLKVALIGVGLLSLILGAMTAWRAEESLGLLAVGAVLVIAGIVIAPDWRQIDVAMAGIRASVYREVEGDLEEAGREVVDQEARQALEQIRTELDARSRSEQRRAETAQKSMTRISELNRQLRERGTRATHSFRPDGRVQLTFQSPFEASEGLTCEVRPPVGPVASAEVRRTLTTFLGNFNVVFPDEFPGSAAPVPGRYEVSWFSGSAGGSMTLITALIRRPIATDAFTIIGPSTTEQPAGGG